MEDSGIARFWRIQALHGLMDSGIARVLEDSINNDRGFIVLADSYQNHDMTCVEPTHYEQPECRSNLKALYSLLYRPEMCLNFSLARPLPQRAVVDGAQGRS